MSNARKNTRYSKWAAWFVNEHGKKFLCRVPPSYFGDSFNLMGLETSVPQFDVALKSLLDCREDTNSDIPTMEIAKLYGLIHARFIVSQRGIEHMKDKFERGDFGVCPRFYCYMQHVLPIGQSDAYGVAKVMVYCPRCNEMYSPNLISKTILDGSWFGTGFPHMFLMQFPHLRPKQPLVKYIPRLYGFQLHKSALEQEGTSAVKKDF